MTTKLTVLCVDDEKFILTMLQRLLTMEGYQVLTASSPQEGIRLAHEHSIDLIISDYQMPEMTGVEMFKEILKFNPNCPKVVLTGQANEKDLENALNEKLITHWWHKPINPKTFKNEVLNLLTI